MIYMKLDHHGREVTVLILETANLTELMKGRPAHSPDKEVMIGWTPDMPWLAKEISKLFATGAQTARTVGPLIVEAAKRPENPTPPRTGEQT